MQTIDANLEFVPTQMDVLLARRELELEKKLVAIEGENRIEFYSPHEKQYIFHTADYRFRHCRWGNQSGKSDAGGVEDVSHALGYRPFMEKRFPVINGKGETVFWHEGYKGHPFATLGLSPRPTKGLIIVQDWEKSKEVFTEQEGENKGKLFHYIPKNALVDFTRNHSGAIDRILIRHRSGGLSAIHIDTIKSYKQDPMALESSIWDWIHVDEPCPEGMFKAAARGLMRRNGRAWLNLTALREPWIQDMFAPDTLQLSDTVTNMINNDKIMIPASMHDNPHLSPEGRAAFISLLTEDERECRVSGIPAAYSGIVYKEFRWDKHVLKDVPKGWKSWDEPPADHCIRYAIDYHPRKPHHVLFLATSSLDVTFAYAEIHVSCLASEMVEEIKHVLKNRDATVPGLIDPLAKTPNQVTDITFMDELVRQGLALLPATKDPQNGIIKAKEVLSQRDKKDQPTFFVRSTLKRFIFEISRGFVWDGETNKPLKENDDAMENFYRLCLQGLSYIEPADDGDWRAYTPRMDFDNFSEIPEFAGLDDSIPVKKKVLQLSRYRN